MLDDFVIKSDAQCQAMSRVTSLLMYIDSDTGAQDHVPLPPSSVTEFLPKISVSSQEHYVSEMLNWGIMSM